MGQGGRLIAGLVAGIASGALHAQNVVERAPVRTPTPTPTPAVQAPAQKAAGIAEPIKDAAPSEFKIVGPDGKQLSPQLERELQEQLKNDPPPKVKEEPTPVTKATTFLPDANGDILVTGQRPRGSVVGNIPAERTFDLFDIRSYGASNIGELVSALGPQVSSSRGRADNGPVVLLNGKRVSSLEEISKIPTEAIERMEVFPEELSLKYGYRADQKVVNVVTFERYTSKVGQFTYTLPTEGGRDAAVVNANFLHIQGNTRVTFDADYNRAGSLLESERNVAQRTGTSDLGRFRTLVPETEQLTLNGTLSGDVLNNISTTLNGRFEASRTDSLVGRGPNEALARDVDKHVAHLGTTMGGTGKWLWSFTGNYDRTDTETSTDTSNLSRDEARSVDSLASGELTLTGSVVKLPAGPVSTTVRGSAETRDFSSKSLSGGIEQNAELSRDKGAVQVDIDFPIANRLKKSPAWLGNLSVDANLQIEQLSDLGTLRTFGYGLNWSPVIGIDLIGSVTNEGGAPTVEQLGSPLVVTPNVSTYDFIRKESVDITRLYGGNASLRSDDRHVLRLAANAKPFSATELTVNVEYTKTGIDHPISSFPTVTPEIEAAFPARFTRDAGGRLVQIDTSPLNFQRSDKEQMRLGINFTKPLGAVPPGMQNGNGRIIGGGEDGVQNALPPGARIVRPQAGSAMARRFENMTSRLTFSLYHTWRLRDEIRTRAAGPVLDLLNGSAVGTRGGSPRHELQFQASAFKAGLGARLTLNWQSGTTVRGGSAGLGGSDGDLNFASYATVNINLFSNLADRLGGSDAPAWLKGLRATVSVNNLFNSRPNVRDEAGATPLSYQAAYLDPVGRSISVGLRKVF